MTAVKQQHTPGPWVIEQARGKHRVRIGAPCWSAFAKVVVRLSGQENDYPEGVANARLIAAAPELLEALTRAANALDHLSANILREDGNGMTRVGAGEFADKAYKDASAVLARVRGEQP